MKVSEVVFRRANPRAVAESFLPGLINGWVFELDCGSGCWSAHLGVKPLHGSFINLNESATRRIEIGDQGNVEPDMVIVGFNAEAFRGLVARLDHKSQREPRQ